MVGPRMSGFLPTVKCSMCAQEIEISMMGEHMCGVPADATPPLDSYGRFDMPYDQQPEDGLPLLKLGRLPPPPVDTTVANRPFFHQDQLTPISASSSPRTPNNGRKSPYGRPMRELVHPPSPEILSSNLDSAFPPFPGPKHVPTKPSKHQNNPFAKASPPKTNAKTEGRAGPVLQRMGTIAPGPFDVNGRPGRRLRTPEPDVHRYDTQQHVRSNSPRDAPPSINSSDQGLETRTGIPMVEKAGGYGEFETSTAYIEPAQQPLQADSRSQTFPKQTDRQDHRLLQAGDRSNTFPMNPNSRPVVGLPRRPSEPNHPPRKGSIGSNGSNTGSASVSLPRQRRPSVSGPDRSRPLPPRGASLIRERKATTGAAPPMPNLAAEFGISNPYHTPSSSESSENSTESQPSLERFDRRNHVDFSKTDMSKAGGQSSTGDDSVSATREQLAKPMTPFSKNTALLESPMDPAFKGGWLSPIPSSAKSSSQPQRRPTMIKGNCKGCGEGIKGKSVSSADGRLTGRYHKQCFVCKTCSEPFATATFYVINDAPYCERHYHKLNGSICYSCDKGIEGQYLETERKQKYHPTCLTCTDCRRVLRDDYFEINERVYCERDAYRKAQQRNFLGTNRMERRTTRLMMM